MKKIITSVALALTAVAAPSTSYGATLVMGQGKAVDQVTAYDLAGRYAMHFYSNVYENGGDRGYVDNFNYITIIADSDTDITIKGFFHEDCVDINASFDPSTMTLTLPNNYALGTWIYNKNTMNEKSFTGYLRMYDTTAPQPNTLSDNDIVFKVDREKRVLHWESDTFNDMPTEQLVIANDNMELVENFQYMNLQYTNFISEYDNGTKHRTAPHFADYDERTNQINAYNFGCQGWYEMPVVFQLNEAHTTATATEQYYIYDASDASWNYWISEVGKMNPFQLTGQIVNGEEGYDINFPDWSYYNSNGQNFVVMSNSVSHLYGEIFGATSEKPIITLTDLDNDINNQRVIITGADDAEIYYTTDGTVPTDKSDYYSGAFTMPVAKTVRAIAVQEGKLPSFITSATSERAGVQTIPPSELDIRIENSKIIAPQGSEVFNLKGERHNINTPLTPGLYLVTFKGKTAKVFVK